MIGAQGFRAREATANYKRRDRKLVTDEVRAIRFANLHGNAEKSEAPVDKPEAPVETVTPTQPEPETTEETQVEQDTADDAADATDEAGDEAKPASKKKAAKAKK